ncbi:MAG: alkaline phosphatase family protein [Dehalococcoidia bacterium]|nr:alkaline phosphatase family protein [Dehalococcoidia bacterium]
MTDRRRVLMIGLDALDHRSLGRWLAEGRLPNLAAFAAQSHRLGVRSIGRTLHGSVWPTFASGQGPGHHGIYWWTQWLAEEGRYVRNSHGAFHYDPFWLDLAEAGRKGAVFDVPYTPAVRRPGVWTANGWGLHDEMEPVSYPERLLPAIRRRYGRHPLQADTMHSMKPAAKRAMADAMAAGARLRSRLLEDFAGRGDWDFCILTYTETHKAGHYLAAEGEDLGDGVTADDALRRILEPLDEAFPRILQAAGPGCDVYLFGLHGIDVQIDYANLGRALAAYADGRPVATNAPARDLVRRIRDLMPADLQDRIWLALPPAVRNRRFGQTTTQGISSQDRIFTVAHDSSFAVRINLLGRDRGGIVDEAEGRDLLARLEQASLAARTDGGLQAFVEMLRPQELHPGPRAHRLPDAVVMPNAAVERVASIELPDGTVVPSFVVEARNGIHTGDGFAFVRTGDGSSPGREVIDAVDFAPTTLSRFGLAIRPEFQGEPFLR